MLCHAVDCLLADVVGAEDEEVGAEGGELADELVVFDAFDAEEASPAPLPSKGDGLQRALLFLPSAAGCPTRHLPRKKRGRRGYL